MKTQVNWCYDIEELKKSLIESGELHIVFSEGGNLIQYAHLYLEDFIDDFDHSYNFDCCFFTNAGNTNNYLKNMSKFSILSF